MRPLRAGLVALSVAAGLAVPVVLTIHEGTPVSALFALPWSAHALGAVLLTIEVGARAVRLMVLARAIGVPLGMPTALLAQLAADAAGAVTPSRGGSEPAKLLTLRRDGGTVAGLAAVALGEMVFESASLLLLATLIVTVAPDEVTTAAAIALYAGIVAAALGLLWFLAGRPVRPVPPRWWLVLRLRPGRWRRLLASARHFRAHVDMLPRLGWRAAGAVTAATLTHQVAKGLVFPALVSASLPGAELPWMRLLLVPFGLVYVGALLPPPGGGGGIELGFVALLGDALPPHRLPALLLWWRAWTHYVSAMVGGLALAFLLARHGRSGTTAAGPTADPPNQGHAAWTGSHAPKRGSPSRP